MRGIPIRKYAFPRGQASYTSSDFSEWQIALHWGVDLERWYRMNAYARLAMIATYLADRMIEAAEANEHIRESKAKHGRPGR